MTPLPDVGTFRLSPGFLRTLKEEEAYGTEYRDLKDARSRIGDFLEKIYNRQRLHSALRYLRPEEFEQTNEARGSDDC